MAYKPGERVKLKVQVFNLLDKSGLAVRTWRNTVALTPATWPARTTPDQGIRDLPDAGSPVFDIADHSSRS